MKQTGIDMTCERECRWMRAGFILSFALFMMLLFSTSVEAAAHDGAFDNERLDNARYSAEFSVAGASGHDNQTQKGGNSQKTEDQFIYSPLKSKFNNEENIYLRLKKGFSFIENSSGIYDDELALTALVLSNEVYEVTEISEGEYESTVQDTLVNLGFKSTAYYYNPKWNAFQPVCCFAHLGDGKKNVFAIIVRGTQNFWSDLIDTDIVDGGLRLFEDAADHVYKYFKEYIEDVTGKTVEQLKGEENYFFITGHSLGGAVANRLSITDEIREMAGNDKDRIYTYTFEAPHTCQDYWGILDSKEQSNSFNFKDVDDAVPNLPPWFGAARYGTDLEFSVGSNEDSMAKVDALVNEYSMAETGIPYSFESLRELVDVSNQLFLGRTVENLDDTIFEALFPNAKGGGVTYAPSLTNYGSPFGHHDIGLCLTYLIQRGLDAGVWKNVDDVFLNSEEQKDYDRFMAGYRAAMRYPLGQTDHMEPDDFSARMHPDSLQWNVITNGSRIIDGGDYYEITDCTILYLYTVPDEIFRKFKKGYEFELSLYDQNGSAETIHFVVIGRKNGEWLVKDKEHLDSYPDPYFEVVTEKKSGSKVVTENLYALEGTIYRGSLFFRKDCIVHDTRFLATTTFEEYVTENKYPSDPYLSGENVPEFTGGRNGFYGAIIFDPDTGMIVEMKEHYVP